MPERRYFPSKPNAAGGGEEYLPLPGQHQSHAWNQPWLPSAALSSSLQQQPAAAATGNPNAEYLLKAGIDPKHASNVIVVDTSSLATSDDNDSAAATSGGASKKASKSSKKRQRQKLLKEQHLKQDQYQQQQPPAPSTKNDLKSGPQVLIKNVNGQVTITPVPEPPKPVKAAAPPPAVVTSKRPPPPPSGLAAAAVSPNVTNGKAEVRSNSNNNQNAATNNLTNGVVPSLPRVPEQPQPPADAKSGQQRNKKKSLGDQNIDDFSKCTRV